MQIEPSESASAERYNRGQAQVVWTTLVADAGNASLRLSLKLGGGKPLSFLLEVGGRRRCARRRHSIIGIEPDLIWRTNGTKAEINRTARAKPDAFVPLPRSAFVGASGADGRKSH